ncbi:MAG TPA: carbohydrate ABC transporter permease [Jiangellaceae bacterium]|nr:carbohydrate ABC transporter permease [Jiangellaceae bacterium]
MTIADDAPPLATTARVATTRRRRRGARRQREDVVYGILRWVTIIFLALITIVPFLYMVILSVRPIEEVLLDPGRLWVSPDELTTSTYREVLTSTEDGGQGFLGYMRNSGFVAVVTVAVTLLASILGAYAVSRLRFRGRGPIGFVFLAVYLFPAILLAIPLFVLFSQLSLRGNLPALAVVYVAQTVPVAIYMLRNYFATIPVSLEEAALIDGCTRGQVIRRISLPLSAPAIVATSLYVFMIAWNEFLFALLFLTERRERWTVSLGLSRLSGSIEIPTTVLMAGSVVLTVPIIVIFFLAERMLVEGLTSGAEKG